MARDRVLSLLSLLNRAHDHSQSSSSTNARATSGATAQTSSRFKPFPRIHPHARSRPRITRARARRASLSRARPKTLLPTSLAPVVASTRACARRLDTCASTFGALPLPRARAPPRSLRTHHDVRASASRKGGRRARIARGDAPARPHARGLSFRTRTDGTSPRRRGRSPGQSEGRGRSVARSIARSFPSVMTGVARS